MDTDFDMLKLLVTGVGLLISISIFGLSLRQRDDAWSKLFAQIHHDFWTDDDIKKVRTGLACDTAYAAELADVLKKRRDTALRSTITQCEYEWLESLDKFLSLMTRVVCLDPKTEQHRELLRVLFYNFWLRLALGPAETDASETALRSDLHWYVREHYPTIRRHFDEGKWK